MDKQKIEKGIETLIDGLGFDPTSDRFKKAPKRIANLYESILSGQLKDPKNILQVTHDLNHNEMVIVKDICFYSMCEHELLPFFGKCHVGYIPENNRIVGINKITELVDALSKRLQLQESLTTQIANNLTEHLKPKGVIVIVEARHLCMEMTKLKQPETKIVTSAVRGIFQKDAKTREEAIALIKNAF